ncbi:organic hydroperoxide reductase OsmC/OhrA [Undibacterium sp. GrIS 1.2]
MSVKARVQKNTPEFRVDASIQWRGVAKHGVFYARDHEWQFDGGANVAVSASPDVVPEPGANPALIDPEEALVAALASCHMMFFLALAAARGFVVTAYHDQARGFLEADAAGRMSITRITLSPETCYRNASPDSAEEARLHEQAHALCFISNSLRAEVCIVPRPMVREGADTALFL